jgi:hypothetical protein
MLCALAICKCMGGAGGGTTATEQQQQQQQQTKTNVRCASRTIASAADASDVSSCSTRRGSWYADPLSLRKSPIFVLGAGGCCLVLQGGGERERACKRGKKRVRASSSFFARARIKESSAPQICAFIG